MRWMGLWPTTSSGCGPTWRPSGGRRPRAATSASRSPSPSASWPTGSASRPPPAGSALESDATGNLVAWWDPDGGVVRAPEPAASSTGLAPRLGAGRRGVRRAAGRGVGAGGGRRAAVARRRADPADRGVGVRRGGGVAVRAGLPGLAAGGRRDHLGQGAGAARPGRRRASRRSSRAAGRGCWTASACFVELHVEQGRDLVDRGAAVGVASEIWPHGRYRFDFAGEANHAGSTRMEDRADPMLTYAMTALAANKQARLAGRAGDVRPGRGDPQRHQRRALAGARPGWTRAARRRPALSGSVETVTRQATERAERDGTTVEVTAESVVRALSTFARTAPRRRRGATGRSSRPRPATTPESFLHKGFRPRCCSSATRPVVSRPSRPMPDPFSHSPPRSTPRPPPGRPRPAWPACTAGRDPRAAGHVTSYSRAGLGRRRRPRRGAGRDRRRPVHVGRPGDEILLPDEVSSAQQEFHRVPGETARAGPHHPRARQRPQPRLPPGAAGPDPARARDVLDLARADVRRGRAADARLLPRARPGGVPRDGRGRATPR